MTPPTPLSLEPTTIRIRWNPKQAEFLQSTARFLDYEGALRSGKTKALVWKFINLCLNHPGIKVYLSRFTSDALEAQLKPKFYEECPSGVFASNGNGRGWHTDQEYQEFDNGSICYLRSLKPSDDRMRFSKTAGLTLAAIGVDQAEELPEDIGKNLIGRISQPGFPQQLVFTPNPPNNDHWIAAMFPVGNTIEDHLYICTSVYDNALILGAKYIQSLEQEYPAGHALHRRNILGRRGLQIAGDPVYGAVFRSALHAGKVIYLPETPLVESWDFGHRHPAVSWTQFPFWGSMHVVAETMGDRVYLEEFIPQVQTLRRQLFGADPDLWQCCDPAGADQNSSGRRGTSIETLNEAGIYPTFLSGSNHPRMRVRAIQRIATYLGRLTSHGPAFQIDREKCPISIDVFEGGYVYPEKPRRLMMMPSLRVPLKDGYYEHLANTFEYAVLNFGADVEAIDPGSPAAAQLSPRALRNHASLDAQRQLLKRAGFDADDDELIRDKLRPIRPSGRAGYS